jgi:hypothetical protein
MANYTMSAKASTCAYSVVESEGPKVRKHVFSVAEMLAIKGSALSTDDTADVMIINAGELIVDGWVRIITASTTSSSCFYVGDQDTADLFIKDAIIDATTTAGTVYKFGKGATGSALLYTQSTSSAYEVTWVGGKYYSAANTVRVCLSSTEPESDGVYEIAIVYYPVTASTTV